MEMAAPWSHGVHMHRRLVCSGSDLQWLVRNGWAIMITCQLYEPRLTAVSDLSTGSILCKSVRSPQRRRGGGNLLKWGTNGRMQSTARQLVVTVAHLFLCATYLVLLMAGETTPTAAKISYPIYKMMNPKHGQCAMGTQTQTHTCMHTHTVTHTVTHTHTHTYPG